MIRDIFFKKSGPNPASFCLFSFFLQDKYSATLTLNDKAKMLCLGLEPTLGGRMVGADNPLSYGVTPWWARQLPPQIFDAVLKGELTPLPPFPLHFYPFCFCLKSLGKIIIKIITINHAKAGCVSAYKIYRCLRCWLAPANILTGNNLLLYVQGSPSQ